MARVLAVLFLALAWLLPLGSAHAHIGHGKQKLELGKRAAAPREGPRGRAAISAQSSPVRLVRAGDGSYVAGFELKNTGDGPLQVYRVAIRGTDDGGPKPPIGLGIQTLPKATTVLGPGESRLYNVVWRPDQTSVTQAYGHVIVETDSAAPGASEFDPPLYLGIVADRRPAPLRHILLIAILLPLLAAAAALAARLRPAGGERALRAAATVIATLAVAASAIPVATFVRSAGVEDGNDGVQMIERAVVGGVDLFLGVDGLTAPLLPIPAVLLLACVLAASDGRVVRLCLFGAPLTSAALLLLSGQSLPLSAVGLVGAALFASMLTTTRTGGRLRPGGFKVLVAGGVASAAFLLLTHYLARATPDVIGVDGKPLELVFALPDAAREILHGHASADFRAIGLPGPRGLFVLTLITAAALSFAAPFHRAPAEVVTEAESSDAALAIGALSLVGGFVLLRFGVLLSPESARWGAPAMATIGVLTIAGAVARASVDTDLRGLAGALPSATGGIVWVAASSLTPQGIQGAIAVTIAKPIAAALFILCAGALVERTGSAELASFRGVGRSAPRLAFALVVAALASTAAPGGASFWGAWLGLVGAVGRAPGVAFALAFGLALAIAAHTRLWRLFAGAPNPSWERAPALEPFGGRLPDLRSGRERAWAFVLVATLVLLTLAPRSWLSVTNHVVLDVLPIVDPPGPTQVASRSPAATERATFPG